MKRTLLFIALVLFLNIGCLISKENRHDQNYSKQLETAKNTELGQLFIKKYPNYTTHVELDGRFGIDFYSSKLSPYNVEPYAHLRIFMDAPSNTIENYYLICDNLTKAFGTEDPKESLLNNECTSSGWKNIEK